MNQPGTPEGAVAPRPTLKEQVFLFFERFGHLMSRILLTFLYVVLVAPAGLLMAAFGDPLRIRRYRGTSWVEWQHTNESLEQARRQD
jgi:hypothetical protein